MITRLLPALLLGVTFVAAAATPAGEVRWYHWVLAGAFIAGLAWWSVRSWREERRGT